jgi:sarcosine oxidase gamma subunit
MMDLPQQIVCSRASPTMTLCLRFFRPLRAAAVANMNRLTPAEFEYLKGVAKTRLELLGPDDDLARYVQELQAKLKDLTTSLHIIRGMAADHNDRPIENEAEVALGMSLKQTIDEDA